jgi:C-terminal binding protein
LLIVGLGRIGTAVAMRAKTFGFEISFYDPLLPEGVEKSLGFKRYSALEEAVVSADCITFHCALTPKTKRFINMV